MTYCRLFAVRGAGIILLFGGAIIGGADFGVGDGEEAIDDGFRRWERVWSLDIILRDGQERSWLIERCSNFYRHTNEQARNQAGGQQPKQNGKDGERCDAPATRELQKLAVSAAARPGKCLFNYDCRGAPSFRSDLTNIIINK